MAAPQWDEGFQRAVLHLAALGDLAAQVPGVFSPELFTPYEGKGQQAPRLVIARAIAQHYKTYRTAPGEPIVDDLLRRMLPRLPDAIHPAILDEWARIRDLVIPTPEAIYTRVRVWAQAEAIRHVLGPMAELTDEKPEDLIDRARALIEPAFQTARPTSDVVGFLATAEDRVYDWGVGEPPGQRVPTGFGPLDAAIGGGVARGEVFYFLAPPKGGKTAVLANVALHASRLRYNVLLASFEMSTAQMLSRLDRRAAKASKYDLRDDPAALDRALKGFRASGAGEIFTWAGLPRKDGVAAVAGVLERLKAQGVRIDLLIFDYLSLMSTERNERERRHELAWVSREIAALGRQADIPTWSALLVNRKAVDKAAITKIDVAEAFEVIAVAHGVIGICGPPELREKRLRAFYLAALREDEDEKYAGFYTVDFARGLIVPTIYNPNPPPDTGEGKGATT